MRSFKLLPLAAASIAALGMSSNAQADAYAYAYNNIFNLLIDADTANTPTAFSPVSRAEATYNGAGPATADSLDAAPAEAGPDAPGKANNDFTPTIAFPATPTDNVFSGVDFSRGDAQIVSTQIDPITLVPTGNPTQAVNVAESNVTPNNRGTAGGTNFSDTTLEFTAAAGTVFTIDFLADPFLRIDLALPAGGDALPISLAQAGLTVVFTARFDGAALPFFQWSPDGGAGGIIGGTETSDPFSLNLDISANAGTDPDAEEYDPTGDRSFGNLSPVGGSFGATFTVPGGGPSNNIVITASMAETVATQLTEEVPEPTTLALLGLGLTGLGFARRQKKVTV